MVVPGEEAGEEVPEWGEDLIVEDDVYPGIRHYSGAMAHRFKLQRRHKVAQSLNFALGFPEPVPKVHQGKWR